MYGFPWMTGLREGSVDQIGGVQGVVGTNDNAEMTDGEELGVVERHTGGICWIQKGVVLTTGELPRTCWAGLPGYHPPLPIGSESPGSTVRSTPDITPTRF